MKASMASQYSIGASDLDARGYVVQYPTFRFHNGGTAYFRADGFGGMQNTGQYNGLNNQLPFALGLRNRLGNQIARVQFAPNEKGQTKPFGRIPKADYATNARMVSSPDFYSFNPKCGWHGLLTLSGA